MYLLTEHSRVKVPPSATLPLRFRGATDVIWKTSPFTATAEIAVNNTREVLIVAIIDKANLSLVIDSLPTAASADRKLLEDGKSLNHTSNAISLLLQGWGATSVTMILKLEGTKLLFEPNF